LGAALRKEDRLSAGKAGYAVRGKRFPRVDLLENDADLGAVRRLPGFGPLRAELAAKNAGVDEDEGT
jgi:hypothetical protein